MKLIITIETTVSASIAETIQRSGFSIEPDGSGMKIIVPNSPTIPKRKVTITYTQGSKQEKQND